MRRERADAEKKAGANLLDRIMLHPPRRMADYIVIGFEPRLRHARGTGLAFSCWTRHASVVGGRACTIMPAARRKFARAKSGHRDPSGGQHAGADKGAKPVLYGRTRSVPRRDAPLRVARDRALSPMNGTRPASFRASFMRKASEIGLLGLGFPGRIWRRARRPVHEDRGVAGARARRRRRRQCQPDEPHHRLAADRARRAARGQGAGAAAGAVGREDFGARDHRAERRLRCRQSAHQGAARRRPLCRQRREDVYHLGHAGRLSDRRGAHRRRGRRAASACC